MQSTFNNEALRLLPKVIEILKTANEHQRNQIIHISLREVMNSHIPLIEMTEQQKNNFEDKLITRFEHHLTN